MSSKNNQRTALVTGSNRGIGFETAKQLARSGFHDLLSVVNLGMHRATSIGSLSL
jgi:NAD(P)-dependent dehydrogenase (short-subunit alcohol dehydrogenase family)